MPKGVYPRTPEISAILSVAAKRKFANGYVSHLTGRKPSAESIEQGKKSRRETADRLGYWHSLEQRKQKSEQMLGRNVSWGDKIGATLRAIGHRPPEAAVIKSAELRRGKPLPEETRKKQSLLLKGRPHSEEHNAKLRGRKVSEEVRRKQSERMKGTTSSLETRLKLSIAHKGKKSTPESNLKRRISIIKRIENRTGSVIQCNYKKRACFFFEELNSRFNLDGMHAERVGEFGIKSLGYFVDYYEPRLNLVIEWNEEAHYNFRRKERDLRRQAEIEKELGCTFINIREKTFEQDREGILEEIRQIIAASLVIPFVSGAHV